MMHTIHPIIFTKAGSAPAFDIASLPLTLYLDGSNYTVGSWPGSASAGTSAAHSATTAGFDPTVGAALNAIPTVSFVQSASGLYLNEAFALSAFITASAWSFWCLGRPTNTGSDQGIFGDPGTRVLRIALNSGGSFHPFQLDTAVHGNGPSVPYIDAAWNLLQAKYDGTTIWARSNSDAWQGALIANIGVPLTSTATVGRNSTQDATFNGLMASMGMSPTTFSDATFDSIKTTLNTRFGLAL